MENIPLKKILVVEDEEKVLSFICNILRYADYDVISASNGATALKLALTQKPDLVVLDIVLPDMSGGDIVRALAGNDITQDIPILYLTGIVAKNEEAILGNKTGKHRLLAKPTTREELLAVVNEILK